MMMRIVVVRHFTTQKYGSSFSDKSNMFYYARDCATVERLHQRVTKVIFVTMLLIKSEFFEVEISYNLREVFWISCS
jgi:hypothetical protein